MTGLLWMRDTRHVMPVTKPRPVRRGMDQPLKGLVAAVGCWFCLLAPVLSVISVRCLPRLTLARQIAP
jgi:hypothetical protein